MISFELSAVMDAMTSADTLLGLRPWLLYKVVSTCPDLIHAEKYPKQNVNELSLRLEDKMSPMIKGAQNQGMML